MCKGTLLLTHRPIPMLEVEIMMLLRKERKALRLELENDGVVIPTNSGKSSNPNFLSSE